MHDHLTKAPGPSWAFFRKTYQNSDQSWDSIASRHFISWNDLFPSFELPPPLEKKVVGLAQTDDCSLCLRNTDPVDQTLVAPTHEVKSKTRFRPIFSRVPFDTVFYINDSPYRAVNRPPPAEKPFPEANARSEQKERPGIAIDRKTDK